MKRRITELAHTFRLLWDGDFLRSSRYIHFGHGTVKSGTVKSGTVKSGTVKSGTVKSGTMKSGKIKNLLLPICEIIEK